MQTDEDKTSGSCSLHLADRRVLVVFHPPDHIFLNHFDAAQAFFQKGRAQIVTSAPTINILITIGAL
jgi:hypothetical protein